MSWPQDKYGKFHTGDSYIVLNSYTRGDSDKLYHDVHIWIGVESSQDEYGTAAYKMVEADDFLGGAAVQHRQVQGHESPLFQSYFDYALTFVEGGAETGFNIVEPTKDVPHLYRVKGTQKGMSLTQMELSKSSLSAGDSFILVANKCLVWLWNGESANPDEKARANAMAEKMCTMGTVKTLDQGAEDELEADFWAFLGQGEIQDADDLDCNVQEFAPLLFKLCDDPQEQPEQIAQAEKVKIGFGASEKLLQRSLLDETNVYLLDAGWEIFVWIGKSADRSEKLLALTKSDAYCKQDTRTADLPLSIIKSGFESPDFTKFFYE